MFLALVYKTDPDISEEKIIRISEESKYLRKKKPSVVI